MITPKIKQELAEKVSDASLPLEERKKAYIESRNALLNPVEVFDPATFDPQDDDPDHAVKRRNRKTPPSILPDMGMLPKEILEGQMIGMFESKQDLYLLIAWLSRRVTALETEVDLLKQKPK